MLGLLRWIYDALAVIGAAALAIFAGVIIYSAAARGLADLLPSWRERRVATSSSPAAAAATASESRDAPRSVASPALVPLGREQAAAAGVLLPMRRTLFADVIGTRELKTRNAWIERHGRRQYLLVTRDVFFVNTNARHPNQPMVIRLPDGTPLERERHRLPDGSRVAFARFCDLPPDSLVATFVPAESVVTFRSEQCR